MFSILDNERKLLGMGAFFILLHHFVKKTRKTPRQEIDKAKRYLADFIERTRLDD